MVFRLSFSIPVAAVEGNDGGCRDPRLCHAGAGFRLQRSKETMVVAGISSKGASLLQRLKETMVIAGACSFAICSGNFWLQWLKEAVVVAGRLPVPGW